MTHRWLKFTLGLTALASVSAANAADVASYVPADTIFYDGMTSEFPKARFAKAYAPAASVMDLAFEGTAPQSAVEEGGPGAGMLTALFADYTASFGEDDYPMARFGMGADGASAMYTVGALPVVRLTTSDREAFQSRLEAAREAAGVEATEGKINGVAVQRYAFAIEQEDRSLDLVVASHDDHAVLTLAGTGIPKDAVTTALGENKPAQSLADSERPAELTDRHDLMDGVVTYVDTAAIVAGLADSEANRFGAMIKPLLEAWGASEDVPLKAIRTPACRKEATAMAESAPYMVTGFTEINPEAQRVQSQTLLRLTNSSLRDSLAKLRGHIPSVTDKRPLIEIGLGLQVQEVVGTLKQLANGFTQTKYECPGIQKAQKAVNGQSIGQLGMFSAMLGDSRGVSAALLSLGGDDAEGDGDGDNGNSGETSQGGGIADARAAAEVATSEPRALWQLASSSLGLSGNNAPKPGGAPVAIDAGSGFGLDLKAALRPNALVVLLGDTPLPEAAGEKGLNANGVLRLREDLGALARAADETNATSGLEEGSADAKTLKKARSVNAYIDLGLDFSGDGVAIDMTMAPAQ